LSGNSAGSASGIFPDAAGGGASGSGSITSSTITGNTVGPNGGLTDPPSGSGIFAAGPLRVLNSIVDSNPGVDCAEGAPSSIDDVGHNFGSDPGCPAGFADANPLLDPAGLAANGGPTATIRLLAGSPAIDFVPVAACIQHPSATTALTIDQRGSSRPTGPACDSGAFEVQPISPLPARKKRCKKHRKKKRHRAGASKKHKKKCKKKKKKK
jgi:hypothetical protein